MQALAGNRCHLSLLQKVLGDTRPELPFLVHLSMIRCSVLRAVDTAIRVVVSAGERNMHSVGSTTCKLFDAVHPVIYFVGDPAVAFRGFVYEAAAIVNQFLLESFGRKTHP